jgi:hypothetical protein
MPGNFCEPVRRFDELARVASDSEVPRLLGDARQALEAAGLRTCPGLACLRVTFDRLADERPRLKELNAGLVADAWATLAFSRPRTVPALGAGRNG